MKYWIPFCLFIVIYLASCKKEDDIINENTFLNTISSDSDMAAVGSIQMEDGNMLIVGRRFNNNSPGIMVKINQDGRVLWKKNVSSFNCYLWDVITIPGTGFATLGANINETYMSVCFYDNDGNYLSKKRINANYSIADGQTPYEIIQLSNGNFAVAGSSPIYNYPSYYFFVNGYLKILDHDFNLLYSKAFSAPANYKFFIFQGLSELPDGNIAITASTTYRCLCDTIGNNNCSSDTITTNTILVTTDLTGVTKSYTLLEDWVNSETPNAVSSSIVGTFAVTSKMTGGENGYGGFINYYNRKSISGRIFIELFNSTGQLTGNKEIVGFPKNGLINSLRSTSDGGYILCGTVDIFDSPFLMSQTKIYVCKLDGELNMQWSKVIKSDYESVGVDALETMDGGYMVSGQHKSFNDHFEMLLIKTDGNGNY